MSERKHHAGGSPGARGGTWKMVMGAAAAAVLVVAGLITASVMGNSGIDPANLDRSNEASALVAGIPAQGMRLGDPDAPVVITEYLDVACPACARASGSTVKDLIQGPVRDGQVALLMHPISFLHPTTSERGALGLIAAGAQGRAWPLADVIMANQGPSRSDWLTQEVLEAAARAAGIDMDAWRAAYDGDEVVADFTRLADEARAAGVTSTPTFVVRGPGGERTVTGASSLTQLQREIEQVR